MKVVEIFTSIEGEGKRAGLPCTFIRLFGCNLNCDYCDTRYATDLSFADRTKEMSVGDIINIVKGLGCPYVTITGGEPLIHEDIVPLIEKLSDLDFWVNVETNGTVEPPVRKIGVFYTMDFKTKSSGMSDKMNLNALKQLNRDDVLKCVVGNEEDIKDSIEVIKKLPGNPIVYFSPIFGKIDPKKIVSYLLLNHHYHYRVQLQLHKYIWSPDTKGV